MITTNAIIKIEKEITESMYLISVSLERYRKWIPGMFLQLSLETKTASEPWLDSRAFSFASWGNEKALLLIRKEGNFTRSLISKAKDGFLGTVRYPFGNFLLNDESPKVFLAGGAGVSVFLSYLDYLRLIKNKPTTLNIFHSVKNSNETIEKIYWNRIPEFVNVYEFITNHNDINFTGRFTSELLFNKFNEVKDTDFYICGPPQFIDYWSKKLQEKGIKPHLEQWINRVNS